MHPPHCFVRWWLSIAVLFATSAQAVVHIGPNCEETTIQHALDTHPEEIEFHVDAGTYAEYVIIDARSAMRYASIVGGYKNCTDDSDDSPGATVLTAQGSHHRVFTVAGLANVHISRLTMREGEDAVGGGVGFIGSGYLTLRNVLITGSRARSGGGIAAVALGDATVGVELLRTLVRNNTADESGGGAYLSGNATLIVGQGSALAFNHALDPAMGGGGLALSGPAVADIGSSGYYDAAFAQTYGAISNNRASIGAGIRVDDGGIVRVFSTTPREPTVIENNGDQDGLQRTVNGGGIAAYSNATVCAWGATLSNNRAGSGAAIYTYGSTVRLSRSAIFDGCGTLTRPARDAVDCVAGEVCNHLQINTGDSVIAMSATPGHLEAEQVAFGGNVILGTGSLVLSYTDVTLRNCLIADNRSYRVLWWTNALSIDGCTIAGNTPEDPLLDTGVFQGSGLGPAGSLNLSRSIVWQPGIALLPGAPGSMSVIDVIASDAAALRIGDSMHVNEADPVFLDPAHGNYHLQRGSPAVDYYFGGNVLPTDIEGLPRGVVLHSTTRRFDAGAFEFQDRLFANGFDPPPQ